MSTHPYVLVDAPDEGYVEEVGWVEATVDAPAARDLLAEHCADADGNPPYRPTGVAERVTLRLTNPAQDWEFQRWVECRPTAKTAVWFWKVVVA